MPDSILKFDPDKKSTLRLLDQIEVLSMKPVKRRRLLRQIGKHIRIDTRQNIKRQRTVTGRSMEPRAKKKRRRMFRKMAKGMVTRIKNDHQAQITWKQPGQARLAFRHHHGISENYTASKAARVNGTPDYTKPATPAQAKALAKEGYRRPVARKRGKGGAILKRVSQKWIRENMTIGQAGLILRLMRTGTREGKQSWVIKLPERPILGATPADANIYLADMATDALQRMKRA